PRIAQTRSCRADRFVFAIQPVTIKRSNFEMIEKQRRAVVFLPLPIFDWSQSSVKPKLLFGVRCAIVLKRQRLSLHLPRETALNERAKRRRKQQLSRRIRLERGANSRPR